MLDFIIVPLVVGIVVAGVYGLFDLFVRRKERMAIIEKIGDKLDASFLAGRVTLPTYKTNFSFNALKIGCLLAGIGLGLFIAFAISSTIAFENWKLEGYSVRTYIDSLYGACVLLCGGAGLIVAFLIEMWISKRDK